MRHRVKLYRPVFTRGDYGERNAAMELYAERWGHVDFRELRSDEKADGNRLTSLIYARVDMYHDRTVQPTWRLVYRGKSYDVQTVLPGPKEHFMRLEIEHDVQKDNTVRDTAGNIIIDELGNAV